MEHLTFWAPLVLTVFVCTFFCIAALDWSDLGEDKGLPADGGASRLEAMTENWIYWTTRSR